MQGSFSTENQGIFEANFVGYIFNFSRTPSTKEAQAQEIPAIFVQVQVFSVLPWCGNSQPTNFKVLQGPNVLDFQIQGLSSCVPTLCYMHCMSV